MGYDARIIKDSISLTEFRLTTIEATFPRMVLAEFNTHRAFSRNSASSRAIPVVKQLRKVLTEPFIPARFGINQSGMQSYNFLDGTKHDEAVKLWLMARDEAAAKVLMLILGLDVFKKQLMTLHPNHGELLHWLDQNEKWLNQLTTGKLEDGDAQRTLNVHKQIANRLLEPFMWHTVIVTATEWSNFWGLRVDKEAQPEIFTAAELMLGVYEASTPTELGFGEWHLPYTRDEDIAHFGVGLKHPELRKISAGRCARVSYLTQAGVRDLADDVKLHDRLSQNGHMSPLEHVARPMDARELSNGLWSGNFRGWHQYRKDFEHEDDFSAIKAARAAVSN